MSGTWPTDGYIYLIKIYWVPLKVMKDRFPIEIAEYAVARGIDTEPAFAYWVPVTLR